MIEDLLSFPCEFPIKIMGTNCKEFVPQIAEILSKHSETFNPINDIKIKHSKNNKYISLTVTIIAKSKSHLDEIYIAINQNPLVKFTL